MPTVLFFTYSEYGQANVVLATSYELALAGTDVYIASFAALKSRVEYLQQLVVRHHEATRPGRIGSVTFCECKGFSSFLDVTQEQGLSITTFPHAHGIAGALASYTTLDIASFPWGPKEHITALENIKMLIASIRPDLVVTDAFFYLAIDACQLVKQKFAIILPNSIKDVAASLQPYLAALWKYPALSSGFPFPLKWWQIPLNAYLFIRLAMKMITSERARRIRVLRQLLGIPHKFALSLYPGVTHICPALPETDFPLAIIPQEMVLCGPIIHPFDPLEKSDPALAKWLGNGPTVMINLGSHFVSNDKLAREMTSAFRIWMDYHDRKSTYKVQVLWKVKPNGDIQRAIDDVVGKEVKEGRIKVVGWLDAEPVSVLQHPNMVCTVHHGGANSFYEGIWSGIPHVILPVWLDTFDYAVRAEYMNVGVFGNKRCAPSVQAEELGEALVRVTADTEEARRLQSTAQRLKALCRTKGVGRKFASEAILKEIGITA